MRIVPWRVIVWADGPIRAWIRPTAQIDGRCVLPSGMVVRVCALPGETDSVNSTTAKLRTPPFANLCIMVDSSCRSSA
ncbi:MAG TPA: hypothetical protein VKF37_19915 [Chloroflexota bacterium]|nr:hypothetical protein [Chloroflexota bacterium]